MGHRFKRLLAEAGRLLSASQPQRPYAPGPRAPYFEAALCVIALAWPLALVMVAAGAPDAGLERWGLVLLGVVPFSALLGVFARDRRRRLHDAVDRLEELERERYRVDVAIHRTGRSLGSRHDRVAMLEVALGTAVDAVAAAAGRARLAGAPEAMVFEAMPRRPGAAESEALAQVERAALAGHARSTAEVGGWHALARPLVARRDGGEEPLGALAVCRGGTPFTDQEDVLFAYLVAQAAASIDSIDAHERLQTQLTVDAVTGLANRRRFQDLLRTEVARADQAGSALAFVVVDVDGLDALTVRHGRALNDAVLREVGAVVSARCRITDEPARYRPERIGILLAGTTVGAAQLMGEEIRLGIAALEVGWKATTVSVTASVGVAALSPALGAGEALLWAAESAAGEARRAGGDRTVVSQPQRTEERRSQPRPLH